MALWVSSSQGAPSHATPVASPVASCAVVPRSREEIALLLADSKIETPPATTGGQTLPTGAPVNADTSAKMDVVVRTWLACQNAGEQLRAWSLFSDGYLHRLLSRQGMPEIEDAVANTDVTAGARLLEIRGQRVLPDGRFGATVRIAYPSVPTPKSFFFYFTDVDGRLVIDGILGEISFSVP